MFTKNARNYILKSNIKDFDVDRITVEKNTVFYGAYAILIDGKPYELRDNYTALTSAVLTVACLENGLTLSDTVMKQQEKAQSLYDELSGKNEGKNFWVKN